MSFEKYTKPVAAEQDSRNNLDLTTVCPDRATAENFNARAGQPVDVAELLKTNDMVVAQVTKHWDNIITKFNQLPDDYKQLVLQSFAPHMYNDRENYPMYNRLVDSHEAKAVMV